MKKTRRFSKGLIACFCLMSLFLFPTVSFGAIFCVSNEAELQTALTTAASNGEDDTIKIVQGTYNGNFTYAATEANSLTVEGGYTSGCATRVVDPANTILDGGRLDHVLALVTQLGAAYFSVEGLTLQNGNASSEAGGGGLYTRTTGHVTLTNNILSGNTAPTAGGGAYVGNYSTLTNNTFTGNTASGNGGGGGGASVNDSTLINNSFSGNTAIGNTAKSGGGAYFYGSATLTNNIFSENKSSDSGGGIYGSGKTPILTNNTISGNTAENQGGGIWVGFTSYDSTGKLYNNIIWNNSASVGADLYIRNTGTDPFFPVQVDLYNNNFDQSTSGTYIKIPFAIDPSNLNNINPLFIATDNYHLSVASPCIDAGSNDAPDLPETDKDGNPRIIAGIVDIGTYEHNPAALIADAGQDQTVQGGALVTLDGSASFDLQGEPLTYLWTQIAGTIVNLSDPSAIQPTFTTPNSESDSGDLIFQLAVTNSSGLRNTDSLRVSVVLEAPVAEFMAEPTSGGKPLTVNFTDQSTGTITSWSWSFGDNQTSAEQNPSHTYTEPGTYTVSLTVTGPEGSDTETKNNYITVNLNQPPVVDDFVADPNSGSAPLDVTFICSAHDPDGYIYVYFIDFGDGSGYGWNETGIFEHTYQQPGKYWAYCCVADNSEGGACSQVINITVSQGCGDYNGDGVVDQIDLLQKAAEIRSEFKAWDQGCWQTKASCGDYNNDGVVDLRDRTEKKTDLQIEFMNWVYDCWLPESQNSEARRLADEAIKGLLE